MDRSFGIYRVLRFSQLFQIENETVGHDHGICKEIVTLACLKKDK